MSNPITPSIDDLLKLTEDELREKLTTLNRPSLWKINRDAIQAIKERDGLIEYFQNEVEGMRARLAKLAEALGIPEENVLESLKH